MLARANRLVRADDYRRLVRRGRRYPTTHTIVYVTRPAPEAIDSPARFGFIVPKTVGIAVERNLIRRRLKALCSETLESVPAGTDIVIRALPGAAQAGWDSLRREIHEVVGGKIAVGEAAQGVKSAWTSRVASEGEKRE